MITLTQIYRNLRYRKGFGVHSPFVYHLITDLIEAPYPYYDFLSFRALLRDLPKEERREAIDGKTGELLYRLGVEFGAKRVLVVGSGLGFATVCASTYAADTDCITLDEREDLAEAILDTTRMFGQTDVRFGRYRETLPVALQEMGAPDLIYLDLRGLSEEETGWLPEACAAQAQAGTILLVDGIRHAKAAWKRFCERPEVTVTIDLYACGLAFFDPKLHKRSYINRF